MLEFMPIMGSVSVVFSPYIADLLISCKQSWDFEFAGWDFLNAEAEVTFPGKSVVVAVVVVDLDYDLGWDRFVVSDGQVQVGFETSVGETSEIGCDFIGGNVEGISSSQGYVFVFGSMVDAVLSQKLKGAVCWVFLENSDSAFGEGHTKFVGFGVGDLYFVAGFEVSLGVASWTNTDEIVFSHFDAVDFGDEFHLFLGVLFKGDGLAKSVHVEIWEGFLGEGGRGISHSSSTRGSCHHFHSGSRIVIADNVDIASNKFKFGSLVPLPAVVVDGHPSSHIGFLLFGTQNNRIVSFPLETGGSVGDLAVGGDGVLAEDLPVEGGDGVETCG